MESIISRFPFPFKEKDEIYRYSNNSAPLEPPVAFEITPEYEDEIRLKRDLLAHHPERCFRSLPHTMDAQWEMAELLMKQMAAYKPEQFSLDRSSHRWMFTNHATGEKQELVIGDESSLPWEPLNFVGRHLQEDLILMMERDGDLYLDAGQLCFPANWSLAFDLGMSFKEIHRPIPGFADDGLADRIRSFLLRLEAGSPWGRRNWSLMAGHRLDTSLETFDDWGKMRRQVTADNAGQFVHLRVEVQKLFRLPRSNGILFTIHTHLLPLEKLSQNRAWFEQLYRILQELPDFIADYKGISRFKTPVLDYMGQVLAEGRVNGQ